jgi:hypothetical protein
MEEHRPKRLSDQVRACLELGEGMPSASNTTSVPLLPPKRQLPVCISDMATGV